MKKRYCAIVNMLGLTLAVTSCSIYAAVSPQEAAQLKSVLTPMGAERAGNVAGTIPAYTGKILGAPSGVNYQGTGSYYPDMYPDEKPLFAINKGNLERYQKNLTPGLVAVLKKFPDSFKLPVYQSHRDVRYSDFIHENTFQNATRASIAGEIGVNGAWGGIPFPIPKNGVEVIWNHLVYPRHHNFTATYVQAAVYPTGDVAYSRYSDILRGPYYDASLNYEKAKDKDLIAYFLRYTLEPVRQKGEIILVHEYLNQDIHPRAAWAYIPGTRRVRRAPTVGYDNPSGAGGLRTDDERVGFNGAVDRYDWKLLGKQEFFIPYNNYKFENPKNTYKSILTAKHPDPNLFRFELHRCWVVEANLKPSARHVYARRFFYLDEDSWMVHLADNYDGQGNLWRTQVINSRNAYDLPGITGGVETLFDLQVGAYVVDKLDVEEEKKLVMLDKPYPEEYFTPANLRKLGSR